MNYISLINRFWTLNQEHCFNASEIALYFHLLDVSNSLAWKNPFKQGNLRICAAINMSEPTIQRAREKLVKVELLTFKSGKVKRELTEYFLIESKGESLGINNIYQPVHPSVDQSVNPIINQSDTPSSTLNDTQPFTEPFDFNKHKQKLNQNFISIGGEKVFFEDAVSWVKEKLPVQTQDIWPMKLYPLVNWEECLPEFLNKKCFENFTSVTHFRNSFQLILGNKQNKNKRAKDELNKNPGPGTKSKTESEFNLNKEMNDHYQSESSNSANTTQI
jgi:hypothetical protein